MLEELACNHHIERLAFERERLFHIAEPCFDPQGGCGLEGVRVDVDADDRVPLEVGARERPVPAPEIEHPPVGATHEPGEDAGPLVTAEDEARRPAPVVLLVPLSESLPAAHGKQRNDRRRHPLAVASGRCRRDGDC